MGFDVKHLNTFSTGPGVYLMKNQKGQILYIGKAKNLKSRIKQYFAKSGDSREMIPWLRRQVDTIETIVTFTEKEALFLENTLIKRHLPKYNVILKDDKTYIGIKINHKHKWPMLSLHRSKGKSGKDALYFGPYTSALAARQTFDILNKLFPLRECSDYELSHRKRPCILYGMKRCLAPCVKKCTKEEYKESVDQVVQFLKGKDKQVLSSLKRQMEEASESLEFEKAAALLEKIKQVEEVAKSGQNLVHSTVEDTDAIGFIKKEHFALIVKLLFREGRLIGSEHFDFSLVAESSDGIVSAFLMQHYFEKKALPKQILLPFALEDEALLKEVLQTKLLVPRQGEKKKLVDLAQENVKALYERERQSVKNNTEMLLAMQEVLKLENLPTKIECFDTSNTAGKEPVASLVAYTDGIKDTKRYRLYKVKTSQKGDDYSVMKEVLLRRFTRGKEENNLPNLIIVDGGKGQLGILREILKELNIASIDIVALAKEDSRHDKGITREKIYTLHSNEPILLDPHSSLLFFLQQIRDEAHRRAINYHKKKRSEKSIGSILDTISGIGPVKKKRLLSSMGSIKRIQEASDEELLAIESITEKDIQKLRLGLGRS